MEFHLRMAGYANMALAGLGVLCTIVLLILFGGPQGILLMNARVGSSVSTVEGIATAAFMVLWLILAGPLAGVGIGLVRADPKARDLGTILSVLAMLIIPLGTIVGIYTLWVLTSFEVEPLFRRARVKHSEE